MNRRTIEVMVPRAGWRAVFTVLTGGAMVILLIGDPVWLRLPALIVLIFFVFAFGLAAGIQNAGVLGPAPLLDAAEGALPFVGNYAGERHLEAVRARSVLRDELVASGRAVG